MTIETHEDKLKAITCLVEEYVSKLRDMTILREHMAFTASEAAFIGARKPAFVALCKAINELDGDLEQRMADAKPQIDRLLDFSLELAPAEREVGHE